MATEFEGGLIKGIKLSSIRVVVVDSDFKPNGESIPLTMSFTKMLEKYILRENYKDFINEIEQLNTGDCYQIYDNKLRPEPNPDKHKQKVSFILL